MGKKYRATAILTREVEVMFEDDGKLNLTDQAHEALEEEHKRSSDDVFEELEVMPVQVI